MTMTITMMLTWTWN